MLVSRTRYAKDQPTCFYLWYLFLSPIHLPIWAVILLIQGRSDGAEMQRETRGDVWIMSFKTDFLKLITEIIV